MKVFLSKCPSSNGFEELVIFADSETRANELFAHFWFKIDELPVAFSGDEYEKWKCFGTMAQLHTAQRAGKEGLGTWDELTGWTILAPAWE